MDVFLKIVSFVGLVLTVVPAILVFSGTFTWSQHAVYMMVGTVLWFVSAPFWMRAGDA
jgi:hypothetical protein